MKKSYPDTVRLLVDSFAGLTPELQKAARFMVEHPEEVGLSSMRNLAGSAGVKPATITRLTKSLGFTAYDELREPFKQRLRARSPDFAAKFQDVQRRGAKGNEIILADLRAQELANVERSLSNDQLGTLDLAAQIILDSKRLYVLGLRGSHAPAFLFHYAYQLFRANSRLLDTSAGIFADQIRSINSDDCLLVVSFPPYTQLAIDAVDYAAEADAKIVAITDSKISPAASAAAATIVTATASPSFYHSFTSVIAVVQALNTLLVTKAGGAALKTIEEAEKQLSRISAYW